MHLALAITRFVIISDILTRNVVTIIAIVIVNCHMGRAGRSVYVHLHHLYSSERGIDTHDNLIQSC